MIYELDDEFREVSIDKIQEDHLTVGYLGVEAFKASYQKFGISEQDLNACVLDSISFRSSMEIYEDYYFGILNLLDINDIYGPRDKIAFVIRKKLFLIIDVKDVDNSTKEGFRYAMQRFQPKKNMLGRMIYDFLEQFITADNQGMSKKELAIEELEEEIHKGDINREFIGDILALKKEITLLRNGYEQFIDICEGLKEDESQIFSEQERVYFQTLEEKIERLSNQCLMLKENLVQVREAYSSSLDYNLNAVMKLFTVVTTIFQPLTLITGWYGMNFTNMPELTWRYGYITVIALSLAVVMFCWWLFKKKRLL
ncbi:MAG: hypothetical protein NC089_09575 [Bacteroides sp.]|nr:hypothetical protein [Bacteroides sp.]MCM1549082.1 hypothetical protein [Clostridium sp.]